MTDFILAMFGSTPLEITAVVLGLLCVGFTIYRSIWSYVFGIPMAFLYMIIFFEYKLYSDSMLQIFFVVVQVYGFFIWKNNLDDKSKVKVTSLNLEQGYTHITFAVLFWAALALVMKGYTDATHPMWDSFIAAASVLAQFWMSRRIIASWIVWMIVDIAAIPLFYIKGLEPTAALYGVFLVMTIIGYREWKSQWLK